MGKTDPHIDTTLLNPSNGLQLSRSCFELGVTLFLYLVALTILARSSSYYINSAAVVMLSLCTVRLFILQHDCGHRSLFKHKQTNYTIGWLLSLFTLTPFHYWRKTHNYHHSHSGIEGKTGIGGIETLSVSAYRELGIFKKLGYRVYRSAFFLLVLAPILLFMIAYRSPTILKHTSNSPMLKRKDWYGLHYLNGAIVIFYGSMAYFFKVNFILLLLLSFYLSGMIGVTIFYIHHNFKETYLSKKETWNFRDASIKGASIFLPPPFLAWFLGNIGHHSIHHLNPTIPFYRLNTIYIKNRDYFMDSKVILLKSIPSQFLLKLYDTEKMITWKEYKNKYVRCEPWRGDGDGSGN